MATAVNPTNVVLTANVVLTFTFDQDYNHVEVLNVDGASRINFTVDGTTPAVDVTGFELPATIHAGRERDA